MVANVKKPSKLEQFKSECEAWQIAAENAGKLIVDKEVHIDNLIGRLHELEHLLVDTNSRIKRLESAVALKDVQAEELRLSLTHKDQKIEKLVTAELENNMAIKSAEFEKQRQALVVDLENMQKKYDSSCRKIEDLSSTISKLDQQKNTMHAKLEKLQAEHADTSHQLESTTREFAQFRNDSSVELTKVKQRLELITGSTIWRWSAPLRRSKDMMFGRRG
jgi:chromosome segregation ATPase